MTPSLSDANGRPLKNLRLSVTDRCNLRCEYCMPEEDYVWLPKEDMLHFEEISLLVDVFLQLGVDRVRLTGGEPLLRRDLPTLVHPPTRPWRQSIAQWQLAGVLERHDRPGGELALAATVYPWVTCNEIDCCKVGPPDY